MTGRRAFACSFCHQVMEDGAADAIADRIIKIDQAHSARRARPAASRHKTTIEFKHRDTSHCARESEIAQHATLIALAQGTPVSCAGRGASASPMVPSGDGASASALRSTDPPG